MELQAIVIDPADNVATIVGGVLKKGKTIEVNIGKVKRRIKANRDIPSGHKIAVANIKKKEQVIKYGCSIGSATEDIKIGDYVHIHNIESNRGRGDLVDASLVRKE